MKKIIVCFFANVILFSSCSVIHKASQQKVVSINSVKYLGGYEVPYNMQFKGTTVGGLSGIDYDSYSNVYYLISDDRSNENPARFYTANISISQKE